MRHATEQDLAGIATLLDEVRTVPGLTERKVGVFYRKSRAFLHFHEDDGKLFADVRLTGVDFDRVPVTSRAAQKQLLQSIRRVLK